ncbi:MAG TPA: maleylpyruvate isomerase family mycothiol-dependent enzyme, partial [Mycobacterium sp.]|nr:maleylpyruvate isomerase family mycothiol-dependent enzyme [Mycobacterium sp.]
MDFAQAFLEQNRAFGELIRGSDPATPVPTCPDWNLGQLFRHVGRGNLWSAQIVADRLDHPLDPRSVSGGKPPDDPDAAITWLHDGAQQLVDAVDANGADTVVWTFLGPRPASWWVRRRLHEVIVHRADAALATTGAPGLDDLAPELVADALTELLELATAGAGRGGAPPPLEDG